MDRKNIITKCYIEFEIFHGLLRICMWLQKVQPDKKHGYRKINLSFRMATRDIVRTGSTIALGSTAVAAIGASIAVSTPVASLEVTGNVNITTSKSIGKAFDPYGDEIQIGVDPKTLNLQRI